MDLSKEIFSENNENTSERIINKIKNGEWENLLKNLCSINENSVILNYIYFKYIANESTYDTILNYITININNILSLHDEFIVHVNMKNLTLIDIDKHRMFINKMSLYLKEKYPKKLSKCYLYNAPFIFNQIFSIVSIFIDKETQKKIELVNK